MNKDDPIHFSAQAWLETIDGDSPLLLIAPHGGRAGAAARATLNPKVNDLQTSEITRELATMLGAPALINAAMDRNLLDLNRVSQVLASAPWFLDTIVRRLSKIIALHGHATVLIIHGWNVIQPRVDLGLGLRRHHDELRPPGSARVSARDSFIHGPLQELARRLGTDGILASFGLRYPGGGAQNLLQAFTDRHRESEVEPLRQLSAMTLREQVDAVQLELSVALRMPGQLRDRCIAAIAGVFRHTTAPQPDGRRTSLVIVRAHSSKPRSQTKGAAAPSTSTRVGIELFDAAKQIGAMASFDLGTGGVGARIMVLLPAGRVALFTGEGTVMREGNRVSLGPLTLASDRGEMVLGFNGPAVIVPDATHYLNIERALASGWLDESMEVNLRLNPRIGNQPFDLDPLFHPADAADRDGPAAGFGELSGSVRIDDAAYDLSGCGRSGLSFTGIGAQRFSSRRMIWACFADDAPAAAVELRTSSDGGIEHRNGRVLHASEWSACKVESVEVETPSPSRPPIHLSATLSAQDTPSCALIGKVENFIPLSRPGPDGGRIYTVLGFARFKLGKYDGAGMFECSNRVDRTSATAQSVAESET